MKIQYLGFLPAIIFVGVIVRDMYKKFKKDSDFRELIIFLAKCWILAAIICLGLGWGLSEI